MILTHTEVDAQICINLLEETAATCGLSLNKQKSNILIFNRKSKETPLEIQGIQVATEIKYLGIKLQEKIFSRLHKKQDN